MDFLQPKMEAAAAVSPKPNLGATLDIITGRYVIGKRGEAILMGGASPTIGVVGNPNAFKSAFIHYVALTILARISKSSGHTYDTESTLTEERIRDLAARFPELSDQDIFEMGRWMITNRSVYSGEVWFDKLKEFMQERIANRDKLQRKTPFMNRDKDFFTMMTPVVTELDSLSAWTTSAETKMADENAIGDSGANTLFIKQGLFKKRLIQEIPPLATASNSFVLMTAHLGEKIQMDPRQPPRKTLQYLQQGLKIKGVAPDFEYLTHICWIAVSAPPLMTRDKVPEYPRNSDDDLVGDTDLVCVNMMILRNKSGQSGLQTQLIYSQAEGLLPSLTEFHYIKEHERFGLEGNVQNYALALLPEVKLSRTTVRSKLERDPILRRAMNITSELCQMHNHWHHLADKMCTAKELYDDLKAAGYDWDVLFKTRGYWVMEDDEEKAKIPFLSTVDLLRMRAKYKNPDDPWGYHPYWMNDDKTVKDGYILI